ncbi:MAG TPA: hypothetical protein VHB48_11100 [Chitinophagaceae bacterium]|nr:hypothetical protein [Chitinophagaceae bacterium]
MTPGEKINKIITCLRVYALGDIHKTIPLDAQLASFILCSCFIDQVAAFHTGIKQFAPPKNYNIKKRFINFCNDYLTKINLNYNSEELYDYFRCGIVHSYTGEKKFALGRYGDGLHLSTTINGRTLLILEDFLADIELAFDHWCADIQVAGLLRDSAVGWFDYKGIYAEVK